MSEAREEADRPALSKKSAEILVAALIFLLGALVIVDSVRLGFRWAGDGPQPGYFPFYVGGIICASAVANVIRGFMIRADKNSPFVMWGQLKLVMEVLIPTAVYALLITWIGIYVASIIFIAYFMRILGKYAWWKVGAVSVGTSVALYFVFEVWFLVPLPKGPVESFLGLG